MLSHSAVYLNCAGYCWDPYSTKETGNTNRCRDNQDFDVVKDSKITMQRDTVAKMSDMNKYMENFTREIETIIIIKNNRKSWNERYQNEKDLPAD